LIAIIVDTTNESFFLKTGLNGVSMSALDIN